MLGLGLGYKAKISGLDLGFATEGIGLELETWALFCDT